MNKTRTFIHSIASAILVSFLLTNITFASETEDQQTVQLLTLNELEELVAPIALYPDDLLGIILPASTWPLQIVQATRYLEAHEQNNQLQPQDNWDDSIVALLNYPEVLNTLNQDLDWTSRLGDAVIAQPEDVVKAVMNFRERANTAGNLRSDEYQTVTVQDDGIIEIQPANPMVIYIPYYQPARVVRYSSRPVYFYHEHAYPVYYYPYPTGWRFSVSYFWGVTSVYSIGWNTHRLHVHYPGYFDHPYYGFHYYDEYYYYRRPAISLSFYNNYYRSYHNDYDRHHSDGDRKRRNRHGDRDRGRDHGRDDHYERRAYHAGNYWQPGQDRKQLRQPAARSENRAAGFQNSRDFREQLLQARDQRQAERQASRDRTHQQASAPRPPATLPEARTQSRNDTRTLSRVENRRSEMHSSQNRQSQYREPQTITPQGSVRSLQPAWHERSGKVAETSPGDKGSEPSQSARPNQHRETLPVNPRAYQPAPMPNPEAPPARSRRQDKQEEKIIHNGKKEDGEAKPDKSDRRGKKWEK